MASVIVKDGSKYPRPGFDADGQQIPTKCLNPDASVAGPNAEEDHKNCPDPLYCLTGRTRAGYARAMKTTYEGALLNRKRG